MSKYFREGQPSGLKHRSTVEVITGRNIDPIIAEHRRLTNLVRAAAGISIEHFTNHLHHGLRQSTSERPSSAYARRFAGTHVPPARKSKFPLNLI